MLNKVKGFFDANKGQSLFIKPFFEILRENKLPELFQKVDGLDDQRLLAIVTALLVENRVDAMLNLIFPRYKMLLDRQEYTFSMKLTTLEALRYLPASILKASHAIRKVRNEFAHNMDLVRFDDLDNKIKEVMMSSWRQTYGQVHKDPPNDLHTIFKNISFFSVCGLDTYMTNVSAFHSKVYDHEFIDKLEIDIADRSNELIDAASKIKPNQIIIKGDVAIVCHEEGKSTMFKLQKSKG